MPSRTPFVYVSNSNADICEFLPRVDGTGGGRRGSLSAAFAIERRGTVKPPKRVANARLKINALISAAYVSIRQHTPAYVSIRQHTPKRVANARLKINAFISVYRAWKFMNKQHPFVSWYTVHCRLSPCLCIFGCVCVSGAAEYGQIYTRAHSTHTNT